MKIEDLVETINASVSRTISLGKDTFENIKVEASMAMRKNAEYSDKELYSYAWKRCKEEVDEKKDVLKNGKPKEPEKKQMKPEEKAEAMKKQDYINKFRRLYESIEEPNAFLKSFYKDIEHNTIQTIVKMLDTVHAERNKNNPL